MNTWPTIPCERGADAGKRRLQVDDAVGRDLVTERSSGFDAHDLGFKVGYPFGKCECLVVAVLLSLEQSNLVVLLRELVDRACGRVLVATEQTAEAIATEQARGDCGTDGTDDAGSEAGRSLRPWRRIPFRYHCTPSYHIISVGVLKAYRVPPESAFSKRIYCGICAIIFMFFLYRKQNTYIIGALHVKAKTRPKTPKNGESHKNKNHASKAMNCFYVLFLEFFRYHKFRHVTAQHSCHSFRKRGF